LRTALKLFAVSLKIFSVTSRFIVSRTNVACVSNNRFSFVSTFSSSDNSSYLRSVVIVLGFCATTRVVNLPFPGDPGDRDDGSSGIGTIPPRKSAFGSPRARTVSITRLRPTTTGVRVSSTVVFVLVVIVLVASPPSSSRIVVVAVVVVVAIVRPFVRSFVRSSTSQANGCESDSIFHFHLFRVGRAAEGGVD
jgi:hypothetical protein